MTDFGRRLSDMLKSDYDPDEDGVIAVAQTEADMTKAVYDDDDDGQVQDSAKLQGSSKTQVQDHTPKSHTHAEANITDLDHDAQKVKGVIINDAAKADQKVLAFDSATDRIVYIEQAPSGAIIDTIQSGEVDLIGVTTKDYTITEVDTTKTLLLFHGERLNTTTASPQRTLVRLLDSTTVRGEKLQAPGCSCVARFMVVEYSSGIASVQRGQTDLIGYTQLDVTITELDVSKSLVSWLGQKSLRANPSDLFITVELLNSTTLRFKRFRDTYTTVVSWEVVEFS